MLDEATVRRALNTVIDPCSITAGCTAGIEELGLVRSITMAETGSGTDVDVLIGVTEPGCIMGYPFVQEARRRLAELDGVGTVRVSFSHDHDWTPADMSETYTARLEEHRRQRRARTGDRIGLPLTPVT
ncbi:metal-sulfur cluster assembly factor [Amycolatopsis jejuensis]|uniref:metal-sulfur cluster assembly factor n=1 Tax=Amycolatopsis jejuensis TaxID=330084 RepID=UPI00052589F3|nr:iron-sulfur cluster assembly protein [Amycolatopsis jejuensis]